MFELFAVGLEMQKRMIDAQMQGVEAARDMVEAAQRQVQSGMAVAQANDAGIDVRIADGDISVAGSYLTDPEYSGHACLVVDASRDILVGATFAGPQTAELVHSATVAIVGEVPLSRLWHAVPSYPTISEVWLRLLDQLR